MTPLQVCEAITENRLVDRQTRTYFTGLPSEERHYWIASLYALLMPVARRRRLAAYFTPPHLAQHAIDALVDAGIQPGRHRILDPASGGAAFLVPLAARIAKYGHQIGANAKTILSSINNTLRGVEIDAGLARLSHLLLSDLLDAEIQSSGIKLNGLIERADTLKLDNPEPLYDAVIGNPPYGRILRPTNALLLRYRPVISDGYVNLYALFVEQALQCVRPGGLVCLIIPMSFVGGPYFAALRRRMLEMASVLRLDVIDKRSDVFLDVLYDLCVIVLRRTDGITPAVTAKTSLLLIDQPNRDLGNLEIPTHPSSHVWALPDEVDGSSLFQPGLETLADYGYLVKTGYFVWNREQHRYRIGKKPRRNEIPLFWAHNVRANKMCCPQDGEPDDIGFAKIPKSSTAIVRSDAIILQRTSNRRQKRRLIGAVIRHDRVIGGRGFVTENHTILIVPDTTKRQILPLGMVCRLLNTMAVDARFRRMSGSVSVSTKALRELPLPVASEVRRFFKARSRAEDDTAAVAAYAASLESDRIPVASKREVANNPRRRKRQ
ncbi:MAG: Eco57I restriction-modification methylase domain-containing protein [Alphaproteobacteria bacterium]|nr:Eco57I restriction-modification methylase domain-containing protein [Alphaproteobacteria bacterium]